MPLANHAFLAARAPQRRKIDNNATLGLRNGTYHSCKACPRARITRSTAQSSGQKSSSVLLSQDARDDARLDPADPRPRHRGHDVPAVLRQHGRERAAQRTRRESSGGVLRRSQRERLGRRRRFAVDRRRGMCGVRRRGE